MKYFGLFDNISLYLDPNILKSIILSFVIGGGLSIKNLMQKSLKSWILDLLPFDFAMMAGGSEGENPDDKEPWRKLFPYGYVSVKTYKEMVEKERKKNQKDDSSKDSKKTGENNPSDEKPTLDKKNTPGEVSQENNLTRPPKFNESAVFDDDDEEEYEEDINEDNDDDDNDITTAEEKIEIYNDMLQELEEDIEKAKEDGEDFMHMVEDMDKIKKELDNLKESKDK